MIELLERTLVDGGSLESAKNSLIDMATHERLNRIAQIEHDFRIATLIKECLMTEPKGTAGFAVAKGIMNRMKEKYRDRASEKFVRNLLKEADEPLLRKEQVTDDGNTKEARKPSDSAGTEQATIS